MKTIDELLPEVKEHERLRGINDRRGYDIQYIISRFKEYLTSKGLDYLSLSIEQAEGFRVYLSNMKDENNKARFRAGSINGYLAIMSAFYNVLLKSDTLVSNPFKYTSRIKVKKQVPCNLLKEKEMNEFLNSLIEFKEKERPIRKLYRYKAHVLAELLYSTGMRIGEAALLKEKDIDFDKRLIKVTDQRTKRKRNCFLNEYTKEVLRIYLKEMRILFKKEGRYSDYLFYVSPGSLLTWFSREIHKNQGKDFSSQKIRQAFSYHLLRAGCDIYYLQRIIGHMESRSTAIYTRVDKGG